MLFDFCGAGNPQLFAMSVSGKVTFFAGVNWEVAQHARRAAIDVIRVANAQVTRDRVGGRVVGKVVELP